jgi:DtxR family Mn-dependent transcriptional regulator
MTDLVDTTEMYLRTIVDLEEEGIAPFRARIAERIGHSGPTVSQTVGRMERDGLVVVEADRRLALTPAGRDKALSVARKHRLAERLLADVIGLDWSLVHDEACRWEHVMSEDVERRLVVMLGQPTESPYGNPIPELDKIGGKKARDFLEGVTRLTDWAGPEPQTGLLRRLGEPAQFDSELLADLKDSGLFPGVRIRATELHDGHIEVVSLDRERPLVLESDIARHLYVAA